MKHVTKNHIKLKQSETNYTMVKTQDEVLTTDEAIQYLKISRPTYFKCIRLGRINAIKVGSGWRVLQSELNRFLKSGRGNRKERLTATR
jgi:excisionase family DNA binding protein